MALKIASRTAPLAFAALVLMLLLAGGARAQTPSDVERAQLLFGEARVLMDDGKFPEACAKFAESQRLSPGGGTILNLGICRRREGRTATAFGVLTEALARARADARADRIATAERHLAELTPQLSRLTIELTPGLPASEVGVELDGEPLLASMLGAAQPLDPGVHRVRAAQAGHEAWTTEVTLGSSADAQRVTVPALRPLALAPPPIAAAPLASTPARAVQPARPVPPPARAPSKAFSYALVSGGAVALGAGAYFGFHALSLRQQSDSHFNGKYCTQPSCVDDWNDAKRAATISTIAVGVGVAVLGLGGYLLLRPTTNGSAPPSMALYVGASPSNARVAARYDF
jgi:hypothetical protein